VICGTCGASNREEARFCDSCGSPVAAPPAEQRKIVTVLFCDVAGSTAMGESTDPEALRATMAAYFDVARVAIERHGGTVEKFIGDAVMAVFGIPQVHEDDAIRAVRAAEEIRDNVALDVRIAVNTGEVVTGASGTLVTGDPVNVAARLEQAAAGGTVSVGESTYRLVRDSVEADLLPPVVAKGKTAPLTAYRLRRVLGNGPVRRLDSRLVGRTAELRMLTDAWERVIAQQACVLFTVLGPPGVGKSRLVREFASGVDGALLLEGRCLSYGEGITYSPVVEVVQQLLAGADAPNESIAALLGDGSAAVDDIAIAVRRLLEAASADAPLIVLFDDVHWGEEAFLNLIEHIADWSRGAPILLLCLARPDLLDRRPSWAGGKLNASTVLLESLDAHESDELVSELIGGGTLPLDIREQILAAAEGNPLFVEEMLAMVEEVGDSPLVVPPTIQALLAARIDQLPQPERSALERGAVEGQVFHHGAVRALSSDTGEVSSALLGLVRKELVRQSAALVPGDEAFRFRHLLIRDAAYDALPKATRATLHERFADWLAEQGADLVELDEMLGYHLEQAALYLVELGVSADTLKPRAAKYLGRAGIRAFERLDFHAARNLLERSLDLLDGDDGERVPLLATLAETVYAGGDLVRCEQLLAETIDAGTRFADERSVARASIFRAFVGGHSGEDLRSLSAGMKELIAALEAAGDTENVSRALTTDGWLHFWLGEAALGLKQATRAMERATEAGSPGLEAEAGALTASAMRFGPTPWLELIAFVESRLAAGKTAGGRLGTTLFDHRDMAEGARGQFEPARGRFAERERSLLERGLTMFVYTISMESAYLEALAGDHEAAERILRRAWDGLAGAGEGGFRSQIGAMLAGSLAELRRLDEAADILDEAGKITASDDVSSRGEAAAVRCVIYSRQGKHEEAIRAGEDAVRIMDATDYIEMRAHTRLALGEALLGASRPEDARQTLLAARDLARAKGSIVLEARIARLIEECANRATDAQPA
jgi:class 3 adenylate cyclase/tetratricopeptide (TPR) repeat protein